MYAFIYTRIAVEVSFRLDTYIHYMALPTRIQRFAAVSLNELESLIPLDVLFTLQYACGSVDRC